ncbi:hypothetical protein Golax_011455 [Gossypium laxum]|uniref:Uncharacterized protein n=1 Tax=Gossypium laxum TaxID=34288 RepID=A0A7J8ZKM1_9ROSI|nr:hypothetical protein [Gossypium laxum]
MMAIVVQTGLKKVVIGKKSENLNQTEWEELDKKGLVCNPVVPREYGIAGGINGEDLTYFVEKNVELQIDDEDQAMLFLCYLPHSCNSFRETLIYGRDKLSFEDVKGHLFSRDKLDNEFGLDSKTDR